MKRFSYAIVVLGSGWKPEDEQVQLNEAGERGFELVTALIIGIGISAQKYFYFKRSEDILHAAGEDAPAGARSQGK